MLLENAFDQSLLDSVVLVFEKFKRAEEYRDRVNWEQNITPSLKKQDWQKKFRKAWYTTAEGLGPYP